MKKPGQDDDTPLTWIRFILAALSDMSMIFFQKKYLFCSLFNLRRIFCRLCGKALKTLKNPLDSVSCIERCDY